MQCGFTSQVLYPASLGIIKLSIILFFIRVLPPDHNWRKPLYGLAAWVATSEAAFTVALFLQCRPLSFYWDKTVEGGTCFDQPKFYYVDATLNMVTDLVILALPWFVFQSKWTAPVPAMEVSNLLQPSTSRGGESLNFLRCAPSVFSPSSRVSFACRTSTA